MPTETAAAGAVWAKWGHVFAGALGIAVTLAWMQTMNTRQMVLAASSGTICILWGTPIAMAVMRGYLPPSLGLDVMDSISGLTGALMGAGGIFVISGFMRLGESFAANPWALLDRLRGKGGEQ